MLKYGLEGVVYPDRERKYKLKEYTKTYGRRGRRVYYATEDGAIHHGGSNSPIRYYTFLARKLWLEGESTDAAFYIGCALHYVHDKCMGTGFLDFSHDFIEGEVKRIIRTDGVPEEEIEKGINDAVSDPFEVEKVIDSIKPSNDPQEVVKRATYLSAWLTKAVLDPGDINWAKKKLEDYLNEKKRNSATTYVTALVLFLIGLAISMIGGSFILGCIFFVPALLGIFLENYESEKISLLTNWFNLQKDT